MVFSKKWLQNHQKFLLHFLIHIDVLMLCRKFELIPASIFRVMTILKNEPFSENFPVLYPMVFSKKWLRNHQKFLLHFLIHIDVLMLCRKFELIPTSIFQVMSFLKNGQFLKNALYYSPCFFPKNGSKNAKKFYHIF